MIRVGLALIAIALIWAALTPSADSRQHPTAFLEQSPYGERVYREIQGLPAIVQQTREGLR